MRLSLCTECGVSLDEGQTCRHLFDALLALEWRIPGGPGELAHFYAVATYGLQHPVAMNYTPETVEGLRLAVVDALAGRASIEQLRQRARDGARERGRITRRSGEGVAGWGITRWPMTVADVVSSPAEPDVYGARVAEWARSVVETVTLAHDAAIRS